MYSWTAFYLFTSANIFIICFIVKGKAAGNSEIELIEESNQKTKTKQKQFQYEETGTSSENYLNRRRSTEYLLGHQNYYSEDFYTDENIAGTTENDEIREIRSITGEATSSSTRKTKNDEHVRNSTTVCPPNLEESVLQDISAPKKNRKEFWKQFLKYRNANPEEVFKNYADKQKLKLCLRVWVTYILEENAMNKVAVMDCEKDRKVKNIKGGPVFQKHVTYGKYRTPEKVTMVGCKVNNTILSSDFYAFIIPSTLSGCYYLASGLVEKNNEIKTINLLSFVQNIELEKPETSSQGVFKPICC